MPSAPLPIDEARRLATLRACDILDTEPEAALDELVAVAAHIAGAPIALISLVDGSRQWFKARIGLSVRETPREQAFCAYAILEPKPLIVEDAALDARFSDNPLVTGSPGIRFYAGFPLDSGDEQRVGTLCVIDTQVRQLNLAQVSALQALARQACGQLKLRRALRDLSLLRERERDLADRSLEARATDSFRVGQILHEGMAAELSGIAESLRSFRVAAVSGSRIPGASLEHSSNRIAAAAHDCRAVARRFRDFSLLSLGWLESVRADIERLQSEHDVQILLEDGEDPDLLLHYAAAHRLAEFVHAALYAIIDCGGARQIRLSIGRHGSTLAVLIRHQGGSAAVAPAAHPNSRLRVLAAELGSVVQESVGAHWNELAVNVSMSAPNQVRAEDQKR